MKNHNYSILIPSFNGLTLLKKHLPSVVKYSPGVDSITIVDDGSIDGTLEYLKGHFPKVTVLHNPKNLGFTKSVNLGIEHISSDFVVLLNNDVEPTPGYTQKALELFDDTVFAVNFNETASSWPVVSWNGKLEYSRSQDKSRPYLTAWASGGSAVFQKNIWKKLGGFDPVFSPGYWEDIDLGWRAWTAGYKIIFDPNSKVIHEHESTFSIFSKDYLNLLKQRNELLFNWKNFYEIPYRLSHYWFLFTYVLAHPGYLKVIFAALRLAGNLQQVSIRKRSSSEIFELVNKPYES